MFVNFEELKEAAYAAPEGAVQPALPQEGRRARAAGSLNRAENDNIVDIGDRYPESEAEMLRTPNSLKNAERHQGRPPPWVRPRHGHVRRLAAGEHRGPREAVRGALLRASPLPLAGEVESRRRPGEGSPTLPSPQPSPASGRGGEANTRPALGTAAVSKGESHASRFPGPAVQPHLRASHWRCSPTCRQR